MEAIGTWLKARLSFADVVEATDENDRFDLC